MFYLLLLLLKTKKLSSMEKLLFFENQTLQKMIEWKNINLV